MQNYLNNENMVLVEQLTGTNINQTPKHIHKTNI